MIWDSPDWPLSLTLRVQYHYHIKRRESLTYDFILRRFFVRHGQEIHILFFF